MIEGSMLGFNVIGDALPNGSISATMTELDRQAAVGFARVAAANLQGRWSRRDNFAVGALAVCRLLGLTYA
jgi:hypothetical protein